MAKTPTKEPEFEIVPFTIVVDTNEQSPFCFNGLKGASKNGVRNPLVIKTTRKPMWNWDRQRWGVGLADYSIEGLEEKIQIERKSISDLFGTLSGRRENFEREIARLNKQCETAAVMIEGSFLHIAAFKEHGPDPSSVVGTIVSWSQRYPRVHWIPAGSRDMAERLTFRILERYWNERMDRQKGKASKAVTFEFEDFDNTESTEGSTDDSNKNEKAAFAGTVGAAQS